MSARRCVVCWLLAGGWVTPQHAVDLERSAREGAERDIAALRHTLDEKDTEVGVLKTQLTEAAAAVRAAQSQVRGPPHPRFLLPLRARVSLSGRSGCQCRTKACLAPAGRVWRRRRVGAGI